jgi:hypothetical protein
MDHEGDQPEAGPRIPGIEFTKAALRDLRNIPARDRDPILARLEAFAIDPSSPQHAWVITGS